MPKLIRGAPFAQNNDCIVSVFIPTRGRPDKLRRAIESLYQTAAHPDRIEVLIRVDDDDLDTMEIMGGLPATALIGPRGCGYLDIHNYHHDMARMARGNWFFVFNDDALMRTQGWDDLLDSTILEGECGSKIGDKSVLWMDDIWLLLPRTIERPLSNEFFVVHRRVFEVLGHLSHNMGVDLWLDAVLSTIRRRHRIAITVEHMDEEDETFKQGRGIVEGSLLYELTDSLAVYRGRIRDSLTLIEYIEDRQIRGIGKVEVEKTAEGLLATCGGFRGLIRDEC